MSKKNERTDPVSGQDASERELSDQIDADAAGSADLSHDGGRREALAKLAGLGAAVPGMVVLLAPSKSRAQAGGSGGGFEFPDF